MAQTSRTSLKNTRESIIRDYRICVQSRQTSLLGRKEVFTGKAKFGIFGEVLLVGLVRLHGGGFRFWFCR